MRAELRLRAAPFGAWVRLGDDTLVAVDRDRARRLGLDDAGAWRDDPPPPEAPLRPLGHAAAGIGEVEAAQHLAAAHPIAFSHSQGLQATGQT